MSGLLADLIAREFAAPTATVRPAQPPAKPADAGEAGTTYLRQIAERLTALELAAARTARQAGRLDAVSADLEMLAQQLSVIGEAVGLPPTAPAAGKRGL